MRGSLLWLPCSFLAVASLATSASAQEAAPDSAASRYVGQTMTVEVVIVDVFTPRGGTTYLTFGAAYANQIFTAVVFRLAAARWCDGAYDSLRRSG